VIWSERKGEDEHHRVHVLTNDKNELLARIEEFADDRFYPWIMDVENPTLLRRLGPSSYRTLAEVKAQCERVLAQEAPQRHGTAAEARDQAYRGRK